MIRLRSVAAGRAGRGASPGAPGSRRTVTRHRTCGREGRADGYHNRLVEDEVATLGGHKGLYSTSFYTEEQFWASYNGPAYAALKERYDSGGRLAGLYEKCVRGQ